MARNGRAGGRANGGGETRLQGFHQLMPYRVRKVLLVASRYDSFIIEEEGQLTDLILKEYDRLNLRYAPQISSTPSSREALRLIESDMRFDLVMLTLHPGSMDPCDFAREVRRRSPDTPVVLLGYDNRELADLLERGDGRNFDQVLVWGGDARILLATVKLIEDAWNADHDTEAVGVEVIIVVEDSVHFISSFLPLLYGRLMEQSQRLIAEGVNVSHKVLRMRARPKVLLASTYEKAWELYERYEDSVLGVISDVRYSRDGRDDPEAGIEFARRIREADPDVPVVLQSTEPENEAAARAVGASFLRKDARDFGEQLERFMLHSCGFGPFVFRMPDQSIVAIAETLDQFRELLATAPDESIRYHSDRNHFSSWLKARTEFRLARKLRPQRVEDFETIAALRAFLVDAVDSSRRQSYRDTITYFDPATFGSMATFARLGGGSLGGKARGLAFLNMLLQEREAEHDAFGVDVYVPPTVVIGTDYFDEFLKLNNLGDFVREQRDDDLLRDRFLDATLPDALLVELEQLLPIMNYPCAVRSSSLLEDSQYQPFAGVYETYMLPSAGKDLKTRLAEFCAAIKLVYASAFASRARLYLQATPQRPEMEKMAVVIQQLIGQAHGTRFYPTFAGVAQSYNYYPFGRVKPADGASTVAFGLGKTVVDGIGGLRFCPKYPRHLPQLSSVQDQLKNTQKVFHALPLDDPHEEPHLRYQPHEFPVADALGDGTLGPVASVYDKENHAVYDGLTRDGTPLVTFAGVLKNDLFPLPELLQSLLSMGRAAMSTPVELEYAVEMNPPSGRRPAFACLQLRPLAFEREVSRIGLDEVPANRIFCRSMRALGNGRIMGLRDIVWIDPRAFDRKGSRDTAGMVAELNAQLRAEARPYALLGPGRWGSSDPWLGIPVNWGQISGARLIVETPFEDSSVTPSDGSHFFHNLIAFHVGYMTLDGEAAAAPLDYAWLEAQSIERELPNGLRWLRLAEPILALIDGETGEGVVLKNANGLEGALAAVAAHREQDELIGSEE